MDEITKDQNSETKISISVPTAIIIAGVLIAGAVFYSNNSSFKTANPLGGQPAAKVDVSADDDVFLGPENAKVIIIEFSDYQCPFCRSFWRDTLSQIKEQYINSGKSVKFVYRDFPLSFHPMAQKYAESAECAGEQNKYWEMHDKIFQEQEKLGTGTISAFAVADVKRWAGEIGLNVSEFNQCLDSGKYTSEVKKDFDDGSKAGVTGTPTFFINGKVLVGAQPIQSFIEIIDSELKK